MKQRKGQALIIVVVIIAIVMAVFANSLTTSLRYHSREETEIYQMEQALYIAEMGINQMIFNINNGEAYNDEYSIPGDAPSGTGSYTTTYHTPDDSGFGGNAYIESTGTVGEISRTVFVSLQSGCWPGDAFQYCLFTSSGGSHGVGDENFINPDPPDGYGDKYKYNLNNGTTYAVPYPDMMKYKATADEVLTFDSTNNTFSVGEDKYVNHQLVYADMQSSDATLTVDFSGVSVSDDVYMSLVTNATFVSVTGLNGRKWYAKEYPSKYPLVVHSGTGSFLFKNSSTGFIWLHGFMYTNGYFVLPSGSTAKNIIHGEIMEGAPNESLGGTATWIFYDHDFAGEYRPYYFEVIALPGTFREDY